MAQKSVMKVSAPDGLVNLTKYGSLFRLGQHSYIALAKCPISISLTKQIEQFLF